MRPEREEAPRPAIAGRIALAQQLVPWVVFGYVLLSHRTAYPAAATTTVRVALMDFTTDENSYWSGLAASDFSTALQAEVSGAAGVDWVERAQVLAGEQELQMSAAGFVSPASALVRGRWVKADWLITGRFFHGEDGQHTLRLEIVDVQHADVLAQTEIVFPTSAGKPLRWLLGEVGGVVDRLHELLTKGREAALASKGKPVIAVLFLHGAGRGPLDDKINSFAEEFVASCERLLATNSRAHLVRFPRANQGMAENALILTGLVDSDPDLWKKAADAYVWGTCSGRVGSARRANSVSSEVVFDATIHVLDTGGRQQVFTETGLRIEDLSEVAARFSAKLPQLLLQPITQMPEQTTRQEIAASLVRRAQDIREESSDDLYAGNLAGRARFYRILQVLETACFLDPENGAAHEELLFARWAGLVGVLSTNQFRFLWNASDSWGKHMDRFGLATRNPARTNGPPETGQTFPSRYVAVNCALAAGRVLELLQLGEKENRGFPADVPLTALKQIYSRVVDDFVKRTTAASKLPEAEPFAHCLLDIGLQRISDPKIAQPFLEALWPSYVRYLNGGGKVELTPDSLRTLTNIYRTLGRPGHEQDLLTQIRQTQTPPSVEPISVKLPRATQASLTDYAQVFTLPALNLLPPKLTPVLERVEFPGDSRVLRVSSMVFHQARLWMITRALRRAQPLDVHREEETQLKAIDTETNRLMTYTPEQRSVTPVGAFGMAGPMQSILSDGDVLWLTGGGVFKLDRTFEKLTHFGSEGGLSDDHPYASAAVDRRLFLIGRNWTILSFDPLRGVWDSFSECPIRGSVLYQSSNQRLAASATRLLYWFGPLALYGIESKRWEDLAPALADSPHLTTGIVSTILPDTSGGFWFGSKAGLHFVEPGSSAVRNWYAPRKVKGTRDVIKFCAAYGEASKKLGKPISPVRLTSRLPSGVTALTGDKEFLFVATEDAQVLVYHKASQSWVCRFNLPAPAGCMENSEQYLWLGLMVSQYTGAKPLIQIRKKDLLSTPAAAWLPDRPTDPEIAKEVGTWCDREQAAYAFFNWDFGKAIQLLEAEPFSNSELEPLLVLGLSYGASGLKKAERARSYFETMLSLAPPGSQWVAEARMALDDEKTIGDFGMKLRAHGSETPLSSDKP